MTTYRLLMGGRLVATFGVAEYRDGETGGLHPMKIPGSHKLGDVTLKRGVVADPSLANWLKGVKTKHQLVIQLMNETGQAVISWSFANATIRKYTGPALNAKGNDIAIEELEIAHEGLKLPPR